MRTLSLPEDVAEALEAFRRAKGRRWRRELLRLLRQEEAKGLLLQEVEALRREAMAKGLGEEEVRRRLED